MNQRLLTDNNESPIILKGQNEENLTILRLALEAEGLRICSQLYGSGTPDFKKDQLYILDSPTEKYIREWSNSL